MAKKNLTKPDWGDVAFAFEVARRGLRRTLSSNELLRRLFGLPHTGRTGHRPGLLIIQIDGLSHRQLQRAVSQGSMPFLSRLLDRENYQLFETYSGLPSSTPCVQGEWYYNVRGCVPAFGFLDRTQKKFAIMYDPDAAQRVEAAMQQCGEEPLLKGGSSWSNVFSGGAEPEECHFCGVSLRLSDMLRRISLPGLLLLAILRLPAVLRVILLTLRELLAGTWDLVKDLFKRRSLLSRLKAIVSRVVICTAIREFIDIGAGIDIARGLPVIHVNFLGYDERAHRNGPASPVAFSELKRIDRTIRRLFRKAHRSGTTDYTVWVVSDHGQEAVRSIAREYQAGIGQLVFEGMKHLGLSEASTFRVLHEDASRISWLSSRRIWKHLEEQEKPEEFSDSDTAAFAVTARGPLAHLYLPRKLGIEQKRRLANWLVVRAGIPGAAFRLGNGEAAWIHPRGETRFPDDADKFLPHPAPIRKELARDFVDLCHHPNAGDMVLLGWHPEMHPWTFPAELGAHAGPGMDETLGFALLPAGTRLPDERRECIRPSTLRAAALHVLGRKRLPPRSRISTPPETRRLRVLSYNVHSCVGLDGRHSPGRIARIIRGFDPDVVALQEIDIRRARSGGENQAERLAEELDMEVAFCCTVSRDGEQYGHALLTRFPFELIASNCFAGCERTSRNEPRGVLLGKVRIGTDEIHVANTHLGLTRHEREWQVKELLGERWLGQIPSNAPLVLCGDFNMFPGSRPYQLLTTRLRDAQLCGANGSPFHTFVAPLPFARIDYVFLSRHFEVQNIRVPRNSLTTVASDHLPLLADLKLTSG